MNDNNKLSDAIFTLLAYTILQHSINLLNKILNLPRPQLRWPPHYFNKFSLLSAPPYYTLSFPFKQWQQYTIPPMIQHVLSKTQLQFSVINLISSKCQALCAFLNWKCLISHYLLHRHSLYWSVSASLIPSNLSPPPNSIHLAPSRYHLLICISLPRLDLDFASVVWIFYHCFIVTFVTPSNAWAC